MKEIIEKPQMLEMVVRRLRAVTDPVRIRLLLRLRRGPANVTELAEDVSARQASASKHLNVLRQAGIVQVRREGTQSIYRIRDASVFELCKLVCDGVVRHVTDEAAAVRRGTRPTTWRARGAK